MMNQITFIDSYTLRENIFSIDNRSLNIFFGSIRTNKRKLKSKRGTRLRVI